MEVSDNSFTFTVKEASTSLKSAGKRLFIKKGAIFKLFKI